MTSNINEAIAAVEGSVPAEKIILHYLRGTIDIDLTFPANMDDSDENRRATAKKIVEVLQKDPNIGNIEIYFHCLH